MDEIIVPVMHQLLARDNLTHISRAHAGKTLAQWEREGRFDYNPSVAAAAVFLAVYALLTVINLVQYFWYRAWFWWPMMLAVIMELVGYAARVVSVKKLDERTPFIIQTILILVAPAVMAAACYMSFGRLVLWVVPSEYQSARHLWLPARRITPLFVGFDVLSFFVQCIGGGIVSGANTHDQQNRGKNILLGGLALQLITFGFFVIASLRFSVLLRRQLSHLALPTITNWRLLLTVINVASATILIRSLYRFVEFAIGVRNYLSDHEAFFYCLDALLIFFVVTAFVFVHPGAFLPYLGLRRKEQKFSQNAGRGFFGTLGEKKKADRDVELVGIQST